MPLNILLADDSMTAQNMAKKILSEAGYEVTTVSNGAAALKKIADRTPDLAILDIFMPGYTGLEVCERVKRAAATSRMPVLLSVGKLEPYREQDATAVRADGVIVKPFEATELVTIVTNIILRASGATMDAAMRPAVSPVAARATPAMTPEVPAAIPAEYSAELANLDTQIQDIDPVVTYGSTTITDSSYENTPLPPLEKALAMAAQAPLAAAEIAGFPPTSQRAEANSSMPFMIDELLKAQEKTSADDLTRSFSGPALDVSPIDQATEEDIEVIEIPAPQPEELDDRLVEHPAEPSAGAPVEEESSSLSEVAGPQELIAEITDVSPDELTALKVEAFLREHAAEAGSEPAAMAVKSDGDLHAQQEDTVTAIAAKPQDIDAGLAEATNAAAAEVVAEAKPTEAPPLEVQAEPTIADGKPVFEVPAFDVQDEPYFALAPMNAAEGSPVVEEPAPQPYAENPLAAEFAPEADSSTTASIAAVGGPEPAIEPPPLEASAVAVQDSLAQKPEIQEPEPQPAAAPPATVESAAEPAPSAAEDFMFSVPMMLEATAAMSLPEMPALAPRPAFEPSAAAAFCAPTYAGEAARPDALDEATIAGVVQRVLDRFKPQIVAEIVRELAKHRQ